MEIKICLGPTVCRGLQVETTSYQVYENTTGVPQAIKHSGNQHKNLHSYRFSSSVYNLTIFSPESI